MSELLSLSGVSFNAGGRQILNDVSLSVSAGEVVSLIGPNGAGKSTLLGVIAGDIAPSSGEILLDGAPLGSIPARQMARQRAMLLQKLNVAFSYTVHEVVQMGRTPWKGTERAEEDDAVVASMMERTSVTHLSDRDITTLSGGESGRAHLARVFAQQTPLILLDEPTAALDITHQEQTLRVLHDLDVAAAYSDRMVLLRGGEVVASGTPEQVCSAELLSEVYQHPIEVLRHPVTNRLLILPKR